MFSEQDELFRRGVDEFNAGRFFEAHEVWEELWRGMRGPERLFVQGLIQTAAGLYHLCCDNGRGARSQLDKALDKLGQFLPAYHGINTLHLVEAVRSCRQDADLSGGGRRRALMPSIELL